ncbi:MAG TPA: PEGA domain-containing protein, partial [Methanoregula sp.]|nr:PEGA domain-containing protein [Methanoregula sp.]
MDDLKSCKSISLLVLLAAIVLCVQPVLATTAVTDSMGISYRGNGGYYIGDSIILDGYNKIGNSTALKLTGPGLPAAGVPIYDLNGAAGTGNPVIMNADGTWRHVWYTSSVKGLDQMQTAKYTITAFDLADPTKAVQIQVMMKRPDFYVVATPDTVEDGDYLQFIGTSEQGAVDIRIVISDETGKVYHTYDTAASRSGYFTYALHADMPPGVYDVTLTSPSVKNTFRTQITVVPSPGHSTDVTTPEATQTPAAPVTTGTLSITSNPSGATVFIDSAALGTTPVTLGALAPGKHLVELKSP